MKLVVGLGNPGSRYADTRHNLGFMVADTLGKALNESWKLWGSGKTCELIQTSLESEKAILLKPLTYMNLSGQAVAEVAKFYKIEIEDICAVHDEIDLPTGDVRLKIGGGPGGHNGVASLIESLGTQKFARVRMGVGRPPHPEMDPADYVLSSFAKRDWPVVEEMIEKALRGVRAFMSGADAFRKEMNTLNRRAAATSS